MENERIMSGDKLHPDDVLHKTVTHPERVKQISTLLSWAYSRKQVQQTLSLKIHSEFHVPEHLIRVN